jgi:Anti-sigma-K factor rskA
MTDWIKDDDRPELEPPILLGLGQAVPQVDPPAELRARVLGAVAMRAQIATTAPSPSYMPWLATAASLALAAGLTIYTVQLRTRITGLEGELRETRARADATERQMTDAQKAAAGAQTSVAVLTAPDVARVDLAGQTVAPQASGRAFWSRSRGMVFNASNLPPLPAGRTYQLWVVTAQAPISAGLLTPNTAGNVSETFNTPPDIPQPVAMAVTIEPAGGVPAPTGDKYLVGVL